MDESYLRILIENNIGMVFSSDNYTNYLKQGMYIHGYDFMNRFLIFFQNRKATDVKDEIAWAECGRKISESNNQILILIPVYSTKYIDKETGKELENSSSENLTPMEINKAVELGILERKKETIKAESTAVYDIDDTITFDEVLLKEYEEAIKVKSLKISMLCDMCKKLCKATISTTANGKTIYKTENNTLYISKENSTSNASAIIKILVTCMVNESIREYNEKAIGNDSIAIRDRLEIKEVHERLIIESILYTVYNNLGIKCNYTLDYVNQIYNEVEGSEVIIWIMDCIERIKDDIICSLTRKDNAKSESKILAIKKAEQLLSILEANSARMLINKGL